MGKGKFRPTLTPSQQRKRRQTIGVTFGEYGGTPPPPLFGVGYRRPIYTPSLLCRSREKNENDFPSIYSDCTLYAIDSQQHCLRLLDLCAAFVTIDHNQSYLLVFRHSLASMALQLDGSSLTYFLHFWI